MTPDPTKMSPESTQTVRRVSHPGYPGQGSGGRPSGGSPRHKGRGGQPQHGSRSSPKSSQCYHPASRKASTPPARPPSYDGVNSNNSSSGGGSPTAGLNNFAGAKFNEAPPPDLLPRPPAHWLANGLSPTQGPSPPIEIMTVNQSLTRSLKFMLNVPMQS
jgi:hypothetical protein